MKTTWQKCKIVKVLFFGRLNKVPKAVIKGKKVNWGNICKCKCKGGKPRIKSWVNVYNTHDYNTEKQWKTKDEKEFGTKQKHFLVLPCLIL